MTPPLSRALRVSAARLWFGACCALAAAAAYVAWPSFLAGTLRPDALSAGLAKLGVGSAEAVTRWVLLAGSGVRMAIFVFCAAHLAWFGRDRAYPLMLAGGVFAYGVGLGLPHDDASPSRALFELNSIVSTGTFAFAAATLPDGRFTARGSDGSRRVAFVIASLLTLWLLMYPVGLPWTSLRDSPALRSWLHVGLLGGGLLAMASRYAQVDGAARVQMLWVFAGTAAGTAAFMLRIGLTGAAREVFEHVVYPFVVCCPTVALALSQRGGSLLWRLGDILPALIGRVLFVAAVATSSLLLGGMAVPLWVSRGATPLGAILACVGLSLVIAWFAGEPLMRVLTNAFFPARRDRERAMRLGVGALDDALTLTEALWAVEGIVELGWPGARVEVYRDVIPGPLAFGSPTLPPDSRENLREPIQRKKILAPWSKAFTLRSPEGERGEVQAFGQLRIIPAPGAPLSTEDLTQLQEIVAPVGAAIWRVLAMERLMARPPVPTRRQPQRPSVAGPPDEA